MPYQPKQKKLRVRLRRFIRQNISERSIMDTLEGNGESIGFITDEGQLLFKSSPMSSLGLLNKCWDGAPLLTLDRAEFEHVLVMSPRVTVSIMTQAQPLRDYLEKRGALARGSGHWARYLIGWPRSTQGGREMIPAEPRWENVPKVHARIAELLAKYRAMVESGEITREVMEFSHDAKQRWFALARDVEWMLRPGEYLHDINDFASKVMEIIGRLAALFHHFSGESGKITLDTLERTFKVVKWHVDEFKRLFSQEFVMSQDQVDAHAVARYLRLHVWRGPGSASFVAKNFLLRNGPVRERHRLNAALGVLMHVQAVWIGIAPKNKQAFVNLLDPYFGNLPM